MRFLLPLLAAAAFARGPASATAQGSPGAQEAGAPRDVKAAVTDATTAGIYLDVGSEAGVAIGTRGVLERNGVKVAEVEVRNVSATSCFAILVAVDPDFQALPGDVATLRAVAPAGGGAARAPVGKTPAKKPPLLAPQQPQAETQGGPIVHGSLNAAVSWLHDQESGRDFLYERLFTRGAVERLFDGPWSLAWGFDLNTRAGDGYDGDAQQDQWRLRADEFVLRRHFEDGSVAGIGRIEPLALPGLGRIDGIYGEKVVGDGARIGAIAGLRPDAEDLGFTAREPVVATWGVLDESFSRETRVTAAAGLLASWFEGASDQQALLADLFARFPGGHWLRASTQTDYYSGDEATRSGIGLTRLYAAGDLRLAQWLDLRATWSQYERPDTDSERDDAPDDRLYGRGNRRGAVALVESWRNGLHLEQEVAQVTGDGSEADWQYTVRASKAGLLGIASLGGDLALFNLVGNDLTGLGTSVGLQWSAADGLYVRLGYDATNSEFDQGDAFLSQTVSLWTTWNVTTDVSLWLRAAKSFGDQLDTLAGDVGLTWRF